MPHSCLKIAHEVLGELNLRNTAAAGCLDRIERLDHTRRAVARDLLDMA